MSEKLELTAYVEVNGTTFLGIYEVKGNRLELTSGDFGEGAALLDGADPQAVAERVLRDLVEQGVKTSKVEIMPDDEVS